MLFLSIELMYIYIVRICYWWIRTLWNFDVHLEYDAEGCIYVQKVLACHKWFRNVTTIVVVVTVIIVVVVVVVVIKMMIKDFGSVLSWRQLSWVESHHYAQILYGKHTAMFNSTGNQSKIDDNFLRTLFSPTSMLI